MFFQDLEQLRTRSQQWFLDELTIMGDRSDEDGQPLTEKPEVWRRDPVECIRDLIGNPLFRDAMAYAPERVYLDAERKQRRIDDMWTADWWWETQVLYSVRVSRSERNVDLLVRIRKTCLLVPLLLQSS